MSEQLLPSRRAGWRRPAVEFLVLLSAAGVAASCVAPALRTSEHASTLAWALTLDLAVVLPLGAYTLIMRPRRWPLVALAPVAGAGIVTAAWILPAAQQGPVRGLGWLAGLLELGLLSWIAVRSARGLRAARRDPGADPIERLRRAAFEITRHGRSADILATELAVLYYSLAAWRARPHVPAGTSAFTHHRRSGHLSVVSAFLLLLAVEGFALHILVSRWSPAWAWIFTIGTAYAALWLVADYRATVLRPLLVGPATVVIRAGLRFSLCLARQDVVRISATGPEAAADAWNLTLLGSPTRWLVLARPASAWCAYGFRRPVRTLGLHPDAAGEFDQAFECTRS